MKKVMLVGLCGGSGAGKGYVAAKFRDYGIPSIDTDAVYRGLTSAADEPTDCMKALRDYFGDEVVSGDNSLNRAAMRNLVFGEKNHANLDMLNKISHKFILAETKRIAEEYAEKGFCIVLIDAPVLFESGFDKFCEKNICVTADEDTRIRRITERDGISPEDAKRRILSQTPVNIAMEKADYVITNNGDDRMLGMEIKACADELKELYKRRKEAI